MKFNVRSILLSILGLLLVVFALTRSFAPQVVHEVELMPYERQWLQQHRLDIRIAPLPSSHPIEFFDQAGNHLGLTADYFSLIEEQLNIRFIVVQCDSWKEILEKLEAKEVDLVGSIQNTAERREFLRFTKPYLRLPNIILTRKGTKGSLSVDTLDGLRIAIVGGSATYDYLAQHYPAYDFVPVKDAPAGLHMLSLQKVDAMVADLGVASYYIEEQGISNLRVAGDIDYAWELCLASRKDWPFLNLILDKTLSNISKRQRREIRRRWITLTDTVIIPRHRSLQIIVIISLVTLLASGSVALWNRILKRQMRHRTHELGRAQRGHQQATRALGESEERFRALVESSNDMIWEMDRLGSYTYVSPHVRDILGYEPQQVVGRSSFSFMTPADSAKNMAGLRKATANTTINCEANTHLHKNGRRVILETSGMAYADSTGRLSGFRGVSRDITERIEAEVALKESEERFRNLVETTSDWIWEADTEGNYTYVSPQIIDRLGYTPAELIGKHFSKTMPTKEAHGKTTFFADIVEQGAPIHSLVNINRHKDGRIVVLETSAVPFYDENWNIQGYRGISRDITERTAAEKQLEFERNLFRSFMEHAPDLIYFKDAGGRFIEVNTAKANEVRLPPEELIGKTDFDFLPAEQAQQKFDDELEVMRTEKPMQKEEVSTTPKGDRCYFTTKVPRYDEKGKVVGTFGTSRDITEQKQSAEELRHLRVQLSNIIDSMPSILVGVDAEGHVMHWNREAERVTGTPANQAHGQLLESVFPSFGDEMDRIVEAIGNRELRHDERIPCTIGNEARFADVTVYPLSADGADGAVIRVDDATDRVRIEEMMVQSEKMMSVGGLAAGMAHEINNPLAGILQNLEVMRNRITHDTERNLNAATDAGTSLEAIQTYMHERGLIKMMDSVTEAGRRATKIVDNMLSFSRKDEAHFAPNDLREILERSIELASNDYNLKKRFDFRHIQIEREYDDALDTIPCESSQMQQVILNLLSNSAQAIAEHADDSKPPRITLRLKRESDMALIEVEDNGPGMDVETRKRVFEPFFTTKEVGHGTGLGLSVSYFIITENHGGTMRVRSAPGQGTCFSIRIPFEHRQAMWGLRL